MSEVPEERLRQEVSEKDQKKEDSQAFDKKYACEYSGCGARFLRPNRLEIHYRTHTGEVNVYVIITITIFFHSHVCYSHYFELKSLHFVLIFFML